MSTERQVDLDKLPIIGVQTSPGQESVGLMLLPLGENRRNGLRYFRNTLKPIKDGYSKENFGLVRGWANQEGLILSFDPVSGNVNLLNHEIPVNAMHNELRSQGHDPNKFAMYMVGSGANALTKELSEDEAEKYYFKLSEGRPKFEVAYFSTSPDKLIDPTPKEVWHRHPNCKESFFVLNGSITFYYLDENGLNEITVAAGDAGNESQIAKWEAAANHYHLLTKVEPGTNFIIVKIPSANVEDPVEEWPKREFHPIYELMGPDESPIELRVIIQRNVTGYLRIGQQGIESGIHLPIGEVFNVLGIPNKLSHVLMPHGDTGQYLGFTKDGRQQLANLLGRTIHFYQGDPDEPIYHTKTQETYYPQRQNT